VLAVLQRDTVLVHVHGGHVAVAVGMDRHLVSFPSFPVVTTAVDGQRRGRMLVFDKGQNVPRRFVDRCASTVDAGFRDRDLFTPGFTSIPTAPHTDVRPPPGRQNGSFRRDDHVGESFVLIELLDFQRGFPQKGSNIPVIGFLGRIQGRQEAEAREHRCECWSSSDHQEVVSLKL
jgi:hypothetical protein